MSTIRNFPRHLKTAFQNIWRNGVMSVSSIVAVMITLTLIAVVLTVAVNVNEITVSIENSLSIYVKVDRTATDEQSKAIGTEINKISGVKEVTYSTKDEELDKLIEAQDDANKKLFENYRDDNPLGDAYVVEVEDVTQLETVATQIEEISSVKEVTYGGDSTSQLVSVLENIRNGGAIFVVALIVVVLFMIANTIKMAITSRSTEIAIMRMVGASNWYIRIPFMLEGALIGLIGSVLPIVVLNYGYTALYTQLTKMMGLSLIVFVKPYPFVTDVSMALAGLGAVVGLIGAFFSVRRYLKF